MHSSVPRARRPLVSLRAVPYNSPAVRAGAGATLAALRSSSPAAGLRLALQPDHQRISCVQRHAADSVARSGGGGVAQSLYRVPPAVVKLNR